MSASNEPQREQLLEANEAAARYFREQLVTGPVTGPRDYLTSRGFAHLLEATPWTVGYAPAGWTRLQDHLLEKGFDPEVLLAAGLVSTCRRGTTIDRFRDRITFGIRDAEGQLVGFTGRCSPGAGEAVPKYLNSPRSILYDKSSVLFGLGEQGSALRDGANLVLVEGPLDALAVDVASKDNGARLAPLAACGTSLTHRHGELLARIVHAHVIVAFDRDPAGVKASESACAVLSPSLDSLFAARLPDGSDPAHTLVGNGSAALLRSLTELQPLVDQIVEDHLAAWPNLNDNAEARVACLRELSLVLAKTCPRTMARQASRLCDRLGLGSETVTRELADAVIRSEVRPHLTEPVATRDRESVWAAGTESRLSM
jgi:DNA primase